MEYKLKLKTGRSWFIPSKTPLYYSTISIFIFLISFFSACALLTTTTTAAAAYFDIRSPLAAKADFYIQDFEMVLEKRNGKEIIASKEKNEISSLRVVRRTRRFLSWPGSSPPRCSSKCGHCTPCKPVHVSVPPGTPVTTEYYPEAWRCKCGNKVFMP
ncbi:hypothetical protein U1Q18_020676 [Sarracenia purpurea var. burkii]